MQIAGINATKRAEMTAIFLGEELIFTQAKV
jgi:hypothetical protein